MPSGRRGIIRAIGRFLVELAGVFLAGVLGFFAMLLLIAGAALAWLVGCMSGLFLLIAVAESGWWLHTHSHHAAVAALGYYGYAAGTFAMIPVLLFLKEKLIGWPERRRQQVAPPRIDGLRLAHDAPFEPPQKEFRYRQPKVSIHRISAPSPSLSLGGY
jgi:hypothetical protein